DGAEILVPDAAAAARSMRGSGPAARRSAIVRGPPSKSSAAARQPSPTTTPRVSPVVVLAEIRRTWAPGVQYSGQWTEDWTIRYGDRRVNHWRERPDGLRPPCSRPTPPRRPQRRPTRALRHVEW